MANVVEYVLKITGGKSQENIKKLAKNLKVTVKDLKNLGKQSAKSFNDFRKNSKKATEAVRGMRSAFTSLSIGIGGTAAAFVGMNKVIADSVNEIVDASTRSGIATETLAGLRLAAEGSGKSFKDLERGLDNFSKKVVDANNGTSASAKEFAALGISVKDANGNLKSSNEIFNETIQRLARVKDSTQKNAIAMKLFGRSGAALIQSGAIESMDKFVGRAKELGIALDEDGVQKAAEFQRGMADLKTASLGALQSIAEGLTGEKGLGPSLSVLAEDLSNFGGGMKIFLDNMRDAFGGMLIFIDSLSEGVSDLTNDFLTLIGLAPDQIEKKFFEGVKTKRQAGQELEDLGVIETETPIEELIDQSRRDGAKKQKVIRTLIKQLALEADSFKDLMEERKEGNEVVDSIFSFLKKESGLNITEIRDAFNSYVTQNKETRKAIAGSKLERLTKLIQTGDIKDIESISKQLQELKKSLIETGQATGRVDRLIISLDKLKKQAKSDIKIDLSALGGSGDGEGKPPPPSTGFIDFQKKLAKNIKEATRAFEKQQKEIGRANNTFLQLKKTVNAIGKSERPFQDVIDDLDETKKRFKELGKSTIPVLDLKMQVIELRREVEKLATTKTAINITTDIIGIAGGDILGGVTGILQKTLKGPALELLGPASGAIDGLVSFGSEMMRVGEEAVKKVEERREQNEISRIEEALGRSLSTAEKERVQNDIRIGDKERRKISEQAMRDKAKQDVKQFVTAIEVGMTMLPDILLSVFPRLFIDLTAAIVNAVLQLPGRIAIGVVNGFKGVFDAILSAGPQLSEKVSGFFSDLAEFFGIDSKRSGGRMVSARRGLRFTGSSDTMAQLHRNEYVVPESGARPQAVERIMNQQSGSGINITINADIVERDAVETLVRKIEQRFQNFGTMQSTLFGA